MAEHAGKDILSSDVEIKGSIKFQKELLIDGKVEGEINSDGVLTIGENADIRGEIKTKSITVFGKVQGNITVGERCELKSKCALHGDLKGGPPGDRGRCDVHRKVGSDQWDDCGPQAGCATRPEIVRNEEPVKAFAGRG